MVLPDKADNCENYMSEIVENAFVVVQCFCLQICFRFHIIYIRSYRKVLFIT